MVKVPLRTPVWWEDPTILITGSWLAQWGRPTRSSSHFNERINTLTRTFLAVLIISVLLSMLNHDFKTTLLYSIVLGLIITLPELIEMIKSPSIQENFVARITPDEPAPTTWTTPTVGADDSYDDGQPMTLPSPRNPFMNVLVDEIKYNPNRPQAASVESPVVKATLDDYFRVNWFSDPTDVFGRNQSQREFITMPSTTIPNDRESYQNWLYKIPGKTCKEGGREACIGGTEGAVIPWLNN